MVMVTTMFDESSFVMARPAKGCNGGVGGISFGCAASGGTPVMTGEPLTLVIATTVRLSDRVAPRLSTAVIVNVTLTVWLSTRSGRCAGLKRFVRMAKVT